MLLLKRLATAVVLFCILFVAFFVGTLMVGGGIAGARAGQQYQGSARDFHTGFEIGQRAGREFSQKYGLIILLGSFCGAGATSLALSFSGIFPWCRKSPEPQKWP